MRQFRDEAGESEHTTSPAAADPASALSGAALSARMPTGAPRGGLRRAALLRMQQGQGNAVVARLVTAQLQRKPPPKPPPPPDMLIRGLGRGMVAEADSAAVYASPAAAGQAVSQLPAGKSVKLIATAGEFYAVEIDGSKGYIKQTDLVTAIDMPGERTKAEWDARLKAMSEKMTKAGRVQGKPLRGGQGTAKIDSGDGGAFSKEFMKLQDKLSLTETWDELEEEAQHLLRDYALWYMETWHGSKPPANVRVMFEYIGRSTMNTAAATKDKKYKGAEHFGGFIQKDKTPSKNWCTQTTTLAVLDAIKDLGSRMTTEELMKQKLPGAQKVIYGNDAYSAPLMPGDMVFYLFTGCQYGGHAVTVIDDLGDSFTHISGNTGDAISVGIGEAKRMKQAPSGSATWVLGKACPGAGATPAETTAMQTAATEYIKKFNLGDKYLVYSITRYGSLLNALEAPKPEAKGK